MKLLTIAHFESLDVFALFIFLHLNTPGWMHSPTSVLLLGIVMYIRDSFFMIRLFEEFK